MLPDYYIAFSQLGSYISVHVSLNLLNEFGASDIVFDCFLLFIFIHNENPTRVLLYFRTN